MKRVLSVLLITVFFTVIGCSGGSSETSGGADEGTVPQNISGTYTGTWQGSGTTANGPFTCSGTFDMTISQSGGNLVVRLSVDPVVITACNDFFDFSGSGTYNQTTGAISLSTASGNTTVTLNGSASELNGQITISGAWSATETASANVIASGTWTATRQ